MSSRIAFAWIATMTCFFSGYGAAAMGGLCVGVLFVFINTVAVGVVGRELYR